jgi:hypothetical protein
MGSAIAVEDMTCIDKDSAEKAENETVIYISYRTNTLSTIVVTWILLLYFAHAVDEK